MKKSSISLCLKKQYKDDILVDFVENCMYGLLFYRKDTETDGEKYKKDKKAKEIKTN
jgi:hypothetical protein